VLGPLTTDQVPVPDEGELPTKVVELLPVQIVAVEVFVAVVGGLVTVIVTLLVFVVVPQLLTATRYWVVEVGETLNV
jgi:hypothetical protein